MNELIMFRCSTSSIPIVTYETETAISMHYLMPAHDMKTGLPEGKIDTSSLLVLITPKKSGENFPPIAGPLRHLPLASISTLLASLIEAFR